MNEVVSTKSASNINTNPSVSIKKLLTYFEQYSDKIDVLSLDCFDTLLWRTTAEPRDVFHQLENDELFKSHGLSFKRRADGEANASQKNRILKGKRQSTLKEIYQNIFPALDNIEITKLMNREIETEIEFCYPFPITIELMRKARQLGKKIIIVSDTYLEGYQLQYLLENKLPSDVVSSIDKIFTSCDYGKSKSEGLFHDVLLQINKPAHVVLHVGDNPFSDRDAPIQCGIKALHLVHHTETMTSLMRMQSIAASFIDPRFRHSKPLLNPLRGIIASGVDEDFSPSLLGYATLGPILFSFAHFILEEKEKLEKLGKRVKTLFLLRDAYLPSIVCQELAGKSIGQCVKISRFMAYASSFRTQADVENYLSANAISMRFNDICTQLMLSEEIKSLILNLLKNSTDPVVDFSRMILDKNILDKIFENSKLCRQRLITYLKKTIDLQVGDTLLFIDLGYSCSIQIKLEPIFKEELNVDIVGRYLIALHGEGWNKSRIGFLDPTHFSEKQLGTLIYYIGLFEKLCSSSEKSTVGFDNEGNPIFCQSHVNEIQLEKVRHIQEECLRFVKDAARFITLSNITLNEAMYRDIASINLIRLIFLPMSIEVDYLSSFQCEINLGTNESVALFDLERGMTSLRQRTWLYATKENIDNMRLTYSYEYRSSSIELAIAAMAQIAHGFELSLNDMSYRREKIAIVYADREQNISHLVLEAMHTHEGYYVLHIPIMNQGRLGVVFGKNYQWIELGCAQIIPVRHLYARSEFVAARDASSYLSIDQMENKGDGLFKCLDAQSMLVFVPSIDLGKEGYALRVTFRPIVKRSKEPIVSV